MRIDLPLPEENNLNIQSLQISPCRNHMLCLANSGEKQTMVLIYPSKNKQSTPEKAITKTAKFTSYIPQALQHLYFVSHFWIFELCLKMSTIYTHQDSHFSITKLDLFKNQDSYRNILQSHGIDSFYQLYFFWKLAFSKLKCGKLLISELWNTANIMWLQMLITRYPKISL